MSERSLGLSPACLTALSVGKNSRTLGWAKIRTSDLELRFLRNPPDLGLANIPWASGYN